MKKMWWGILLALCLLLVGCGSQGKENDEQIPNEENKPSTIEDVDLAYQNDIHNDASFFYDNGWVYGLAGGPDGHAYFLKVRTDGTEATNLGQFIVRDPFLIENYIYFMGISTDDQGIYKMRTSGENLEKLSG